MQTDLNLLSEFELLDITGKDCAKFLQGQFTCDVNSMQPNQFYLGAVCNPKGQMFANFVIAPINNGFRLRLAKGQGQNIKDSLSKYAVFFKVQMQLASNYQVAVSMPETLDNFNIDDFKLKQDDDEQQTLYWPDGRIEKWILSHVDTNLNISSQWQSADIKAGIYWLSLEQSERWIPQMIHWQKLGGVSFTKGCYTGQEVIARLQHLGKSKKNLIRFQCSTPQKPQTQIYNELEKVIGVVLHFQSEQGLAMLNTKANSLYTENTSELIPVYDELVITPNS